MSGLYLHFPFCKKKCIYCNFYSVGNTLLKAKFITSLFKEIEIRSAYLGTNKIDTVYWGGGTPTIFTIKELAMIIEKLKTVFEWDATTEFTIEANPEQLSAQYLKGLHDIGINRLSIGIQSFEEEVLNFMGRLHNAQQAKEAVMAAQTAGFNNISIDLIYGIALRSAEQWQQELETAFSLPINHLSAYALTVEENTLLYKKIKQKKIIPSDEEKIVNDYHTLLQMTEKNGFKQYEVSNFAKDGMVSKHNSNYWKSVSYIGLGPSAHSYNLASRQWNVADIKKYVMLVGSSESFYEKEMLSSTDKYNEYVMLRLRTTSGIDLTEFEKLFGKNQIDRLLQFFQQHVKREYYLINDNHLHLTATGFLLSDNIIEKLFITVR